MRTRYAPEKANVKVPIPPRVTLGMVTHITPHEYYKDKMAVIRLSLTSMLAGARDQEYELIVWDNGSIPELREMIRDEFKPQIFIESLNVGAHDGRHGIAQIARGKFLSMADDDVLFFPFWLGKQIKVVETYRDSTVAGSPFRAGFGKATSSNLAFIRKHKDDLELKVTTGKLMPDEWTRDFAISVGRNPDDYLAAINNGKRKREDVLLEYRGVKAWAHGHHLQVIGRTYKIAPHFTRNEFLVNSHQNFNDGPDRAGIMNLCTYERTAIHIGNVIDDSIRRIAREAWSGDEQGEAIISLL